MALPSGGFLVGFAETLAVFNWSAVLRPVSDYLPEGWSLPSDLALVPTDYKLTVAFEKAGEKKVIDSFVEKADAS